MKLKNAADLLSGASAASPIPVPQISTLSAPGKRGPAGMAPRVSNSRVNTGVAPAMDAGASEQKSAPPMGGASMLQAKTAQLKGECMATVMGRPSIQDMIKAAVAGTAARMSVNAEALHQMKLASAPDVAEKKPGAEKLASTEVEKLAAALDYAALCVKEGSIQIDAGTSVGTGPGQGPNASHVMESPDGPPISANSGHAIAKNIPPMTPAMQGGAGNATLLKNDIDRAPGGTGHQRTALPIDGAKTAAPLSLILKKVAEDRINPAQISAGRTVPPDTREAGQAGPASPAGSSMVASSQSVTNLTRREAKAAPKADMRAYIDQPALSAEHDHVLENAFRHTGAAGAKIAEDAAATSVKTAASRVYLQRLVDEVTPRTSGRN